MFFHRIRSQATTALRATQCGDEVIIDAIPAAWTSALIRHLHAAGFDGRSGGPIGLQAAPGDANLILHVHNACVHDVRHALESFSPARGVQQ